MGSMLARLGLDEQRGVEGDQVARSQREGAMLLDDVMPTWDATRREHRTVSLPPASVFGAARHADFLDAVKDHLAVRAMFAVRAGFERIVGSGETKPPEEPEHLRLGDLPTTGDWVLLGEREPEEIVFGVVGRFWGGETSWEQIDAKDFAGFDRTGFAKIACNVSLRPYGDGETLLSYEARTLATDAVARKAFLRYWWVVSPFVGYIMRSTLQVIDREARCAAR
jgi:hypothetical protein